LWVYRTFHDFGLIVLEGKNALAQEYRRNASTTCAADRRPSNSLPRLQISGQLAASGATAHALRAFSPDRNAHNYHVYSYYVRVSDCAVLYRLLPREMQIPEKIPDSPSRITRRAAFLVFALFACALFQSFAHPTPSFYPRPFGCATNTRAAAAPNWNYAPYRGVGAAVSTNDPTG
jgi:hypothetical protein